MGALGASHYCFLLLAFFIFVILISCLFFIFTDRLAVISRCCLSRVPNLQYAAYPVFYVPLKAVVAQEEEGGCLLLRKRVVQALAPSI